MGAWQLAPAGFIVLMVAGPFLAGLLTRWGLFRAARTLALAVYPWMALIMWFFLAALALDLWNLGARLAGLKLPAAARLAVSPRAALLAAGGLSLALGLWSAVEARRVRLRRVVVRSARLAPGSAPVTIAQISDLHLGLLAGPGLLDRVGALVREARPDLIVSTGDLVDSNADHGEGLTARLAALEAPLGKFAVFGNHEYYAGAEFSRRFLEASGFRLLRGEAAEVAGGRFRLVGVDDPAGGQPHHREEKVSDTFSAKHPEGPSRQKVSDTFSSPGEDQLLPAAGGERRELVVLLKHRPVLAAGSAGRFDLQLSGHTHGGQVFPFALVVRCFSPLWVGLHRLPGGSQAYVSYGTGTWGPPMRLLAPPEVALIVIEPER
jgi:hypothetical protein